MRIFKTSVNGREQVLAMNQAGESVAELPVFDGGRFPASAMAIEDTEIAFISRQDFHAFCMEHPEVALKMLAVVGGRLRRLVGIIEELSFTTIRQRLISLLLRLAENEGKQTPQGIEFQLPVSHQELASQLGTVRELVSRNLMSLQAEGLLDVDARQIVSKTKPASAHCSPRLPSSSVVEILRVGHQLHIDVARDDCLPVPCHARHANQSKEHQRQHRRNHLRLQCAYPANVPLIRLHPLAAAASAICSAFSAGHTATHSMHPVHSTDRICTSLSTGRCDGQALLHFPQSMHASASRRIFTGLSTETIPISAPYGQRNRHQKF